MGESFIPTQAPDPDEPAGPKLQSFENTRGGSQVHSEGVVAVDESGDPIALATDTALDAIYTRLGDGATVVSIRGRTTAGVEVEPTLHDLDAGAGAERNFGVSLRRSASGGSEEVIGETTKAKSVPVVWPTDADPLEISASSLPLPTDAATQTTLALVKAKTDNLDVALSTLLTIAAFQARINTLGQKVSGSSTPVVLASDQPAIDVNATLAITAIDSTGGPVPSDAIYVGYSDGTNLRGPRVFDGDSGAGSEWVAGGMLRRSASGGSEEVIGQTVKAKSIPVVFPTDADPVDVVGPVTDAELRASPVETTLVSSDASDSFTFGAVTDEVKVALAGKRSVGFTLAAGMVGGVILELSLDNELTWELCPYVDKFGQGQDGIIDDPGSSSSRSSGTFIMKGGATHARIRVTNWDSGTTDAVITASDVQPELLMAMVRQFGSGSALPVSVVNAVTIAGQVSLASEGIVASPVATSAVSMGASDGTNTRIPRVYDADTGAGTEFALGANLRISASGGSIEAKGQQLAASSIPIVWASNAALPAGTNNIGDVDVLTLPALSAGTNNIGDVDVLTVPADPFGTNADAASSTGSMSAKLKLIASAVAALSGTAGNAIQIGGRIAGSSTLVTPSIHDLDSGAGVEYNFGVGLRRSASGGSTELIGQATKALSVPMTIASDQDWERATTGSPVGVTVSTSAIVVLASNANAKNRIITNNGNTNVFLGRTSAVTTTGATMGILLLPGGSYSDSGLDLYTGDIYGIGSASASSQNLSVWERT